MVHRYLAGEYSETASKIASKNSKSEVCAVQVEREYEKMKQLRYLQCNEQEEFTGKINGLTQRGMFIQIDNIMVDGFIRTDWMNDDYYVFDPNRYIMMGRRYRNQYRIGQHVEVKITNISLIHQRLDLRLID
jgi:ribonuclease R